MKNPKVEIIFNGERLKAFPLRSGTRQGSSLSPLLFNTKVPFRASRQEITIKASKQEKIKLSLLADGMILYVEHPNDSTKNFLLELINKFAKVAGHKINKQKSVVHLHTNNE